VADELHRVTERHAEETRINVIQIRRFYRSLLG
jgi:hypothetical protein